MKFLGSPGKNLGDFGDQSTDDATAGENFLAGYIAAGFYTAGDITDLEAYYDSSAPASTYESIGASLRVGNFSPSDIQSIYSAIYSGTKTSIFDFSATSEIPDPSVILAAIAAQPSSLGAVTAQAAAATVSQVETVAATAATVAAVGGSAYLLWIGAGVLAAVMAFWPKHAAPAAQATNPRKRR